MSRLLTSDLLFEKNDFRQLSGAAVEESRSSLAPVKK